LVSKNTAPHVDTETSLVITVYNNSGVFLASVAVIVSIENCIITKGIFVRTNDFSVKYLVLLQLIEIKMTKLFSSSRFIFFKSLNFLGFVGKKLVFLQYRPYRFSDISSSPATSLVDVRGFS
jgi:hypothetical protein